MKQWKWGRRVTLIVAWYDMWVGLYIMPPYFYLFPIPFIGLKVDFRSPAEMALLEKLQEMGDAWRI